MGRRVIVEGSNLSGIERHDLLGKELRIYTRDELSPSDVESLEGRLALTEPIKYDARVLVLKSKYVNPQDFGDLEANG